MELHVLARFPICIRDVVAAVVIVEYIDEKEISIEIGKSEHEPRACGMPIRGEAWASRIGSRALADLQINKVEKTQLSLELSHIAPPEQSQTFAQHEMVPHTM